jgi:hypothetical protein
MGFFNALGRALGGRPKLDASQQEKLLAAWQMNPTDETQAEPEPRPAAATGHTTINIERITDEQLAEATADHPSRLGASRASHDTTEDFPAPRIPTVPGSHASAYDLSQWHKKLKTILAELPDSQGQWRDLMGDVGPLGIDANWVERIQREEFTLLVRRAVADQVVTEQEHERIELARRLVGLSESEAEDLLHKVVAEAESFFGKPIEGAEG